MGLLGIRYWEAKLQGVSYAVVTIDAERSVPISEELFDATGKRLARTEFRSQPARAAWAERYSQGNIYHYNAIQTWSVSDNGEISNVYA